MAELPRTMQVEAALERVRAAVGPQGWTSDPHDMQPSLEDWRGEYKGRARMLVRPAETREVAEVVTACAAAGIPITPQGGNTGLCAGATPPWDSDGIVLSLARMNRIRAIDATNFTMTVEAGCVLQRIQEAALEVDRYFPLSLSAQGSCMIGGNLSTNAGGTGVLRYGNARELTLGLEVVLPDGRTWDGLTALRKDNTGYDLKHLFMGAEGNARHHHRRGSQAVSPSPRHPHRVVRRPRRRVRTRPAGTGAGRERRFRRDLRTGLPGRRRPGARPHPGNRRPAREAVRALRAARTRLLGEC